ncbi:PorP/SprF family type IX secretion system membrane protein [Flavobacterium terrigena]|uniref:Type IX secretion system membrane protein, PorP/SprF family n=1 Tax=Flavobacterium terrigena TaxID=402734 RepID=A0A1H6X952_9FLAO|nr:type IX secretion system membrane protein PorP/SprF [Flavobacterium terrigena]SEJ24606.1 type IX secretion system membrane protein, PorP/SprF family [Flavobacterium terrigena]
MKLRNLLLLNLIIFFQSAFSQEGIAVYTDYLTDNYYLIHPSMAGAANCAKLRVTGRQQWFGQQDAPSLQTMSFNTSLDEDGKSGMGIIAFNDKNGYHSQTGGKLSYAHHLLFSRSKADLNMLSFGLSAAFVQSRLDETAFTVFDPQVYGGITQKDSYFNLDVGASYHYMDFFTHVTVKNFIANRRELYLEGVESDNLRKYLWSLGANFGDDESISVEPSFMFQITEYTGEKSIDLNAKVYKAMEFGKLWGGLSYRRSFDGAQYTEGEGVVNDQKLQWITPFVGVNFKQFMVGYSYNQVMGNVKFDNAGYHQITIGMNLFCKEKAFDCNCPAVSN